MPNVASGLTSKTLSAGSAEPAIPKDKAQVYVMRFCPFAERALIALQLRQVPHEVVNVSLVSKPEWLIAKNPAGKVPVLIHNGNYICESMIAAEYVDEAFPNQGTNLLPKSPIERANQKVLVERIAGKLFGPWHMTFVNANKKEACAPSLKKLFDGLKEVEGWLVKDYFNGDKPGFTDYMLWPLFERVEPTSMLASAVVDDKSIVPSGQTFPKLFTYIERMKGIEAIATVTNSADVHMAFAKSSLDGAVPNYDVML